MITNPSQPHSGIQVAAVLAILLVVDSLHFVFARALEPALSPTSAAFFVLAIGTVEFAVFALFRHEIDLAVFRRHLRFFLAIGILVASSTALNYAAVSFVDPGTASMLAQTATVFALAFGVLWLREKLNRNEWLGAVVCIVGVFLISFQSSNVLRFGSLMVLAAAFMYALHAAIVKRYGGGIDFVNFFLFRLLSVTIFLLLLATAGDGLQLPEQSVWPLLIMAGTVDVVISRVLYYVALRRLRLGIHAVVLTLSPVLTVLFSWVLFQQLPTWQAMVGGLVVIGGIMVISYPRH